MVAANVRYGLTSAPGMRFGVLPTRRKPQVGCRGPGDDGRREVAAWYRLYELIVGAKK